MSLEDNKAVPNSPQSDVSTTDSHNNHSKDANTTTSKDQQPSIATKPNTSGIPKQIVQTRFAYSTKLKKQPTQSAVTKNMFETEDLVPLPDSEVEA